LFGSVNPLYQEFAVRCFRVYLSCVILTGWQRTSSVFFQALGKPVRATILSLVRDLVLLVPLTCLLPLGMGIDGFLIAAPIADVASFILTLGLYWAEDASLKKKERIVEARPLLALAEKE
jgi:Na+-driven multidrug efflux pump